MPGGHHTNALAAAVVLTVGCNSLTGLDGLEFDSAAGGSGGIDNTGGAPTSSSGGSGGMGADYQAAVLASGPLAYYRLGESVGSVATDLGSLKADGTYVGAPGLGQPGALPNDGDTSVQFDGNDDQVEVASISALDFVGMTAFSVEVWASFEDVGNGLVTGTLVSKNDRGTEYSGWALLFHDGSQQLQFKRWDGLSSGSEEASFALADDPTLLVPNSWAHIVGTFDGSEMRLYVDATLRGTATAQFDLTATPNPMLFGAATSWMQFPGSLDEVAIYSRALDGNEVTTHYLAGTSL